MIAQTLHNTIVCARHDMLVMNQGS